MNQQQHKILYTQEQLPIFQNRMYDTEAEGRDCPRGDMHLVEDQRTGLVFNAAFRPELMVYDAHYQNEQGLSPLFRAHLELVSAIVQRSMGREAIVEVGCGKGLFLEILLGKGVDVTGFDPTYEGNSPRVQKRYFELGVGIQAKGLVLRHVLEHIQNPYEFLLKLKEANGGGGKIYIEVPCFDWICDHRAWFDVFYEHVNYFRLRDFHRMFGSVIESGRLFGEQYLFVVADLATLRPPQWDATEPVQFPNDFTQTAFAAPTAGAQQVAIWGGASKGVIFALIRARAGQPVDLVIDINPAKQGKYLPSTGLLVQSPQDALAKIPQGSRIYVMNSIYLKEIVEMSGNQFKYIEVDHG